MAINFPNYLAAPLYKPDYSGISDAVENFYKGKAMPKDDLIKQIQAQFARPNAEAALAGTKLGNEKSRLEINKLRREMQQQAALEAQITAALRGGAMPEGQGMGQPQGIPAGQQMPPAAMPEGQGQGAPMQPNPNDMTFQGGQQADVGGLHPAIAQILQQMKQQPQGQQQMPGQQQPMAQEGGAPIAPAAAPVAPEAEKPNPLQIITQGEPRLASIDALYDQNPMSRALLEKKGFKKAQKIEFDKKTGQTRIMTTYPSGKVTLQMVGNAAAGQDGIPLTNAGVTRHQKIISSVDSALPIIDKILDLKGFSAYPLSSLGIPSVFGNKQAKYNGLVSGGLDSVFGAFGLPATNEGLKTAREQLEIRHWETPAAYRKRLRELKEDLLSRKSYSEKEVKRTNKIAPIGRSGSDEQSYSSNYWEAAQ
jgi:hypothetical protein